jgi:transcriptional regulator with XRE-family HTH domain
MKEAAYTKYERGESKVTIDLVQKVATALEVDPISILAAAPDNFIETISNNSNSAVGNVVEIKGDFNSVDKQQQELMEKLIDLLAKK